MQDYNLQVSVCSGYDLCHPGLLAFRHTYRRTQCVLNLIIKKLKIANGLAVVHHHLNKYN